MVQSSKSDLKPESRDQTLPGTVATTQFEPGPPQAGFWTGVKRSLHGMRGGNNGSHDTTGNAANAYGASATGRNPQRYETYGAETVDYLDTIGEGPRAIL